jgi:hypothetical protein
MPGATACAPTAKAARVSKFKSLGGIFQFTWVCDMIREQWKKIGIQADLADALWRGKAMTLRVSFPLEHPHRLREMFSSHRS